VRDDMRRASRVSPGRQRAEAGVVLVSCTVILCAVLVLALGSQQQVRQAHVLAANLIERNLALHAAEAALLDAEAAIQSAPEALALDALSDPLRTRAYGELTGNRIQAFRMPHYQIAVVFTSLGGSDYFYRITAKGFGQRDGTRIVLQSDFIWSPFWRGRLAWRELSGG